MLIAEWLYGLTGCLIVALGLRTALLHTSLLHRLIGINVMGAGVFLVLIAERRETTPDLDWFRFRARNDDLFHGAAMLGRYYNKDLLMSDRARRTFVLPDRLTTRSLVRTGQ